MLIPKNLIIQIVIVLIKWNWLNKVINSYKFTTSAEYHNILSAKNNNINNSLDYYDFDENLTKIINVANNKLFDDGKNVKKKRSTTAIVKNDEFRYFNVGILMASHLGEFLLV